MGETAGFSSQFLEKAGFNLNLRRNAVPARRLGTPFREAVDNLISGIEPVTACDDPELRQRIFRKASRSFFCAFSNLIPDNQFLSYRKYLILNNDPNGTNISFINCIEPSVAFLVVRNPLDTFANTVLRGYYTATERDARSYAVMMRNRIDAFIESYRQDNLRSRLKALVFERFVMNPRSYGEKIMEYVSLGERHGNRFDPSISSKKIGIGQSLPPEVQVPIKKRALPAWDRLISFLTENRIMLNA